MYVIGGLLSCLFYVGLKGFFDELKYGFRPKKLPQDLERNDGKVLIGTGEKGKIYHNFLKYPHMIISGATGYGKTNMIKSIISQVRGKVVILDLKGGKDYGFKADAVDIVGAREVLERVEMELRRRMHKGVRGERIYVVVDEAAELQVPTYMTRKEGGDYLKCIGVCSEIARLGRSFGIHLIFCTQYPVGDVLPRQIKQNAEARISFRLVTEKGSEVALDEKGAEELPAGVVGRAIYKTDRRVEVQTYEFEDGRELWWKKVGEDYAIGSESSEDGERSRHMYEIG